MNGKHSIFYKYDANTCVRLYYGFLISIGLIFGGGAIAAILLSMPGENDLGFLAALILFLIYMILHRFPLILLFGVLFTDCDPVKMRDIIFIIENKVKVEKAKVTWKSLRALAVSFIRGGEQESFELLRACQAYNKTDQNEFYLTMYARYYSATEDWENYQAVKEKRENLYRMRRKSKKARALDEKNQKADEVDEADEKFRAGEFEEARRLYLKLLDVRKSSMLSKVTIHERLGVMDSKEGKKESAKKHLMFAAQNGGTTYMADEAREILQQIGQE